MKDTILIYNSLTRKKENFQSKRSGEVSMYVCGLTPQDHLHLGHAKTFITFDVIRRVLETYGNKVTYLLNFTDIDDKIISKANKLGEHPQFLAERYIESCLEDMKALNIKSASLYPRAAAHIPEIIEMVEVLVKKGFAYEIEGDVYFRVRNFPAYGKLSGQSLQELKSGVRMEANEIKEDALDFALWKSAKPSEPYWNSPWGPGRPGWHIECSAMNLKYLGMGFDIHGGGQDLVFPHHENEIAQSEAYSGESPYARYFMHSGLFNLRESKMSKSVGNVISLKKVLEIYDPMVVRITLLKSHYRSPMDFYPELLNEGAETLLKLKDSYYHFKMMIDQGSSAEHPEDQGILQALDSFITRFKEHLADDFNYAGSLGVLFQFLNDLNLIKGGSQLILGKVLEEIVLALEILGLKVEEDKEVRKIIELILSYRQDRRENGKYDEADQIRTSLMDLGLIIQDSSYGTRFYRNTKRNNIR
ncbi:MAG: Cysteine--tRNA ligase [candidate division WS2 bacterium]|nr:Cysteine--tRNA ligase [Candidatus Lithacetigena glycinireducens]MBT9174545.1 Cysteine--tRNA ligase [Candidatus Lithacetigena glycinireducens]